jgi:hypothetical protein
MSDTPQAAYCTTTPDGTRVFTWEDTVIVEVQWHKVTRRGKYPVRVLFQGNVVSQGTVDLQDLADRERLHAHCQHLDGKVNWLQRFLQVVEELSTAPERILDRTLTVTQLSTVVPERVEFWWRPFLPKGRPVALEGDPDIGKSSLVLKLTAHLTTGQPFPTVLDGVPPQQAFDPQNVCLLTSEDDPADVLVPRLEVNGGDASRVYLLQGWAQPDGAQGIVTMQALDLLRQALEQYRPALLVFDPFQSFFGRGIDMNHANDTRPVLDAVALLCRAYSCTPLYVRHLGKAKRDKAIHAALGSIDIVGNMRSALLLGQDPDSPHRRILAHSKSNTGPKGHSIAYGITEVEREIFLPDDRSVIVTAPRLTWAGLSDLTADELVSPPRGDDEG